MPSRKVLLVDMPLFTEIRPLRRPRLNRRTGAVYQPKEDQFPLYEEMDHWKCETIDVPVIMECMYVFTNKKVRDIDNLDKAINDCLVLNKILKDDRLICAHHSYKCIGKEAMAKVRIWSAWMNETEFNV